jgi:threonine dehydratase
VLEQMWPLAQEVLSGSIPVDPRDIAKAVKIICERNKVVAEGAGACGVAAAMAGKAGKGAHSAKLVCVPEGGERC